jgi:Derlin-2/3
MSIAVYTNLLSFYWVPFHYDFLLKLPPQVWRLFTSFLLTGPKLSIIFDPYFRELDFERPWLSHFTNEQRIVYTYTSKLEIASPRFARRADFYAYIVFIWVTILVGLIFFFFFYPDTSMHLVLSARTVSHSC